MPADLGLVSDTTRRLKHTWLKSLSKCMHGLYMFDEGLLKDEVKEKDSEITPS